MNQIRKILLPTDFSACAQIALDYVVYMMSQDETLQLILLHVDDNPDLVIEEADKQLNEVKKSLLPHIQSRTQIISQQGALVETILSVRQEKNIDLIVMGTEGGEPDEVSASSHAAQLLQSSNCPVLIIPNTTTNFQIHQIALALDKQAIDDLATLDVLHDVARWFGAKVHVLTVKKPTEPDNAGFGPNQSDLEYYLETLDYHYAFPENADIQLGITNYIDQNNIDLLVILPRSHSLNAPPSPGKLTRLLALHTHIPLLVID
ncbi:MAG: universal stress protein [Bacteroidota bacterium]